MSSSPGVNRRTFIGWRVLLVVLVFEVIGGAWLLVSTAGSMLAASDEPLGQRLSIFLAALIAWLWVGITLMGAVRTRASWVRGSAITIHVLLFAAATGVLQFELGSQQVGWGLVLLAFVGFFSAVLARPTPQAPIEADEGP